MRDIRHQLTCNDRRNLIHYYIHSSMLLHKAATPLGGSWSISGAACGKVVFTADDAEAWAERGEKVVLTSTSWLSSRGHHMKDLISIIRWNHSSLMLQSLVSSDVLWHGLMSSEDLKVRVMANEFRRYNADTCRC